MNCEPVQRLLDAHLDDELDAATAVAVQQHLAGCAGCSALRAERQALRDGLRRLPRHEAPAPLREAVRRRLDRETPTSAATRQHPPARRSWLVLLCAGAGAIASFGLGVWVAQPAEPADNQEQALARHIASIGRDGLPRVDVASSDRHVVKPWFAGKVDLAPPVRDLAGHGFVLLGGRLDRVAGRPAAVLVYRLRRHLVSLFVTSAAATGVGGTGPATMVATLRGFAVVNWARDGLVHTAVADVDARELQRFAELLLAAPGTGDQSTIADTKPK